MECTESGSVREEMRSGRKEDEEWSCFEGNGMAYIDISRGLSLVSPHDPSIHAVLSTPFGVTLASVLPACGRDGQADMPDIPTSPLTASLIHQPARPRARETENRAPACAPRHVLRCSAYPLGESAWLGNLVMCCVKGYSSNAKGRGPRRGGRPPFRACQYHSSLVLLNEPVCVREVHSRMCQGAR